MQAITRRPCLSCSSLNCLTAHWRQAPTEPSAGCQQKYGRSKPSDRHWCRRFCLRVHPVCAIVDVNRRQLHLHGHRFSRMCRSKSSRKYLSALCKGSAAPGASAQNVLPGARNFVWNASFSMSPGCAAPFLHRVQDAFRPVEAAPARRAPAARFLREKMLQIPEHPDWAGLVVQHDHGAGAHAAARFLELVEIHGQVEMLLGQESPWMRRREAGRGSEPRRAFRRRALPEFRARSCPSAIPIGRAASPCRWRHRA